MQKFLHKTPIFLMKKSDSVAHFSKVVLLIRILPKQGQTAIVSAVLLIQFLNKQGRNDSVSEGLLIRFANDPDR